MHQIFKYSSGPIKFCHKPGGPSRPDFRPDTRARAGRKRREGRKPAEPLKNTQQATIVAEKPKRHNRPAKPILARESQQKQSADKPEQASSRSAKLRSRYENYE